MNRIRLDNPMKRTHPLDTMKYIQGEAGISLWFCPLFESVSTLNEEIAFRNFAVCVPLFNPARLTQLPFSSELNCSSHAGKSDRSEFLPHCAKSNHNNPLRQD